MKLEHVKTTMIEDARFDKYTIGNYNVLVETESWGKLVRVEIANEQKYFPDIYTRTDDNFKVNGFEVQTVSYGSLPIEEIKQVIAGLEEAMQVAEILTAEFVK